MIQICWMDWLLQGRQVEEFFFAKNPDDQDNLTSCKEDHLVQQSFLQIIWSICIGQYLAKQNSLKELFFSNDLYLELFKLTSLFSACFSSDHGCIESIQCTFNTWVSEVKTVDTRQK